MIKNIQIYIFCEGKTEKNYIKSLSRLLRDEDVWNIGLSTGYLEGLDLNNYFSKIKKNRPDNFKYFDNFYAWIDYDIFKRGGRLKSEIETQLKTMPYIGKKIKPLFNNMNGEDFIILHEEDDKIKKWEEICKEKNHFNNPMHSKEYLPLFQNVISGYEKGQDLNLTKEKIKKCIENIKREDVLFSSEIEEILNIIIEKIEE